MTSHFTLPGKIYFTAIGPGPTKRLTLRTLELLRKADLVVHDEQVPADVLELIPPHVAVRRLAKELEQTARACEEIQRRMVEAAQNGQCVVRLIFGAIPSDPETQREITTLHEAGIAAEMLPAIASATAEASSSRNSLPLNEEQPPASANFDTLALELRSSTGILAS